MDQLEQILKDAPEVEKAANSTLQFIRRPRAEDPSIKAEVSRYITLTVQELGRWANLSAGQKAMLFCQKTALTIILVAESQVVDDNRNLLVDGKPHPLLGIIKDYLTVFRMGEVALGLSRARTARSDNATLQQIEKEYEKRRAKASTPLLVPEKKEVEK